MSGTKSGGLKAKQTNTELYGKDWYSKIGKLGGSAEHKGPRGFAAMPPEKRQAAGRKGGSNGSRSKKNYTVVKTDGNESR